MWWRFFLAILLITGAIQAQPAATECISCHETAGAVKASIHGSVECVDCHAAAAMVPHPRPLPRVDCGTCHPDSAAAWSASLHAQPRGRGARGASCSDCHGPAHLIVAAPIARAAIPRTCQRCHAQKFVVESGTAPNVSVSYADSVHGRELARGSTKAAVCTDCHDAHAVRPANEPQSSIFKFNVPRLCGRCHAAIAAQYGAGVHGKALARGNWASPVCTDCHGIHTISRASDTARGPRASCARCHESVQLAMELGTPADKVRTYESSYHGLARKLGSKTAADCASCHGAHQILPSADPASAVHRNNLPATCGKCHPGAQANFARGKVHVVSGDVSDWPSRINTWIRWIYTAAIAGAMLFMLSHNFLLWWRKSQRIRREQKRDVVRMNRNQRIQHLLLMISFIVLAVSGFALAWPDSLFAKLCGSDEEVRRMIHRVAAVVMMALGLYHVVYLVVTAEGRKLVRDLRPRFADLRDLFAVFRYYLGLGGEKPTFGRFGYGEKLEYWAGMWGSAIMTVTGIMLWFPVVVTSRAPRWWLDIATTIHFYEAVLATLSILVWHLYHVIFDPDVYPMNWSWLDGKMSDELYREEHGRDLEG